MPWDSGESECDYQHQQENTGDDARQRSTTAGELFSLKFSFTLAENFQLFVDISVSILPMFN